MTIQVRPVSGRDVDAEVDKAVDIARHTPGIGHVSTFAKEEAQKLLEPWLGTGLDLHDLPIPRLVVVKLEGPARPDLAALRKALDERVAGASLDDHQVWLERLATMAHTVVAVAVLIFALVLAAMGLAVGFATRGVMAGNREIVSVLHFVGAEDRFIAREFQRHFRRLGLKGGLIGGGCAALAFLVGRCRHGRHGGDAGRRSASGLVRRLRARHQGLSGHRGHRLRHRDRDRIDVAGHRVSPPAGSAMILGRPQPAPAARGARCRGAGQGGACWCSCWPAWPA